MQVQWCTWAVLFGFRVSVSLALFQTHIQNSNSLFTRQLPPRNYPFYYTQPPHAPIALSTGLIKSSPKPRSRTSANNDRDHHRHSPSNNPGHNEDSCAHLVTLLLDDGSNNMLPLVAESSAHSLPPESVSRPWWVPTADELHAAGLNSNSLAGLQFLEVPIYCTANGPQDRRSGVWAAEALPPASSPGLADADAMVGMGFARASHSAPMSCVGPRVLGYVSVAAYAPAATAATATEAASECGTAPEASSVPTQLLQALLQAAAVPIGRVLEERKVAQLAEVGVHITCASDVQQLVEEVGGVRALMCTRARVCACVCVCGGGACQVRV